MKARDSDPKVQSKQVVRGGESVDEATSYISSWPWYVVGKGALHTCIYNRGMIK